MSKIKIVGIAVFCGMLGAGAAASLFMPPREHSVRENRVLETRPEPVLEDILNGSYQEHYEAYLNDQIFFRDTWVCMAVGMERFLGRQDINGVYIGKDGYLLEKTDASALDYEQIEENIRYLSTFLNDAVERFGKARVTCLLVPDKASALPDKLPDEAQGSLAEEEYVRMELERRLDEPDILPDIGDELRKHQDEYIYYRSDHHWTTLGAYYAYCVWAEATGHTAGAIADYDREIIFDDFYGTTYNKAPVRVPKDSVELFRCAQEEGIYVSEDDGAITSDSFYFPKEAAEGFNRYNVFFSKNTAKIEITTKADTGRSLMIVKDSFANCFVPFLAGDYDKIIMADFRYGNENIYDLLEAYDGITDVLVVYNLNKFMQDTNLRQLDQKVQTMEEFDAESFFDE